MTSPGFLSAFSDVLRSQQWSGSSSPAQLVEEWEGFVESCEEGYGDSLYEYEAELGVRQVWQVVLESPSLLGYPERSELAATVEVIDERFRACARPDVFLPGDRRTWWEQLIPAAAHGDFAEDLERIYGIHT